MEPYLLKIDMFPHIIPPKYNENRKKFLKNPDPAVEAHSATPELINLDARFRFMDKYEPYVQVLTLNAPACWEINDSEKSVDLAKMVNDEMAELVLKHPSRFVAATAVLPMNNMDAALQEADRAINDLNLRGVHILIDNKHLDSPEFMPLFEKMSEVNLPIWFHPPGRREASPSFPNDPDPEHPLSQMVWKCFGYPFETTVTMMRLVFSGAFDKYPNLKFITHHCGGMVPYFKQRMINFTQLFTRGLTRPIDEYINTFFYNDTAIYGNSPGLMCGYEFFGADHIVFGTDFPLGDTQRGDSNLRETINAIELMDIGDSDKKKIFKENAVKLLRLAL